MAECHRCGQSLKWVDVDGGRVPLDSLPQMRPPGSDVTLYRLDPENADRAEVIPPIRNDLSGYTSHRDTCPALVRVS